MGNPAAIGHEFFRFLRELKAHNNREWFQANKVRFQAVQRSMLALVDAIETPLKKICPSVHVDASPVGGSVFRIYRDVRFGKDKSPYKTHMAARFPLRKGKNPLPLGFYLELGADACYIAGGAWQPEPRALDAIRACIAAEPAAWKKAVSGFGRDFSGESHRVEMLKRVPKPYPEDHPCADDLRRKSYIVVAQASAAQVTRPDFAEHLVRTYSVMTPMLKFLGAAMKVIW